MSVAGVAKGAGLRPRPAVSGEKMVSTWKNQRALGSFDGLLTYRFTKS